MPKQKPDWIQYLQLSANPKGLVFGLQGMLLSQWFEKKPMLAYVVDNPPKNGGYYKRPQAVV